MCSAEIILSWSFSVKVLEDLIHCIWNQIARKAGKFPQAHNRNSLFSQVLSEGKVRKKQVDGVNKISPLGQLCIFNSKQMPNSFFQAHFAIFYKLRNNMHQPEPDASERAKQYKNKTFWRHMLKRILIYCWPTLTYLRVLAELCANCRNGRRKKKKIAPALL